MAPKSQSNNSINRCRPKAFNPVHLLGPSTARSPATDLRRVSRRKNLRRVTNRSQLYGPVFAIARKKCAAALCFPRRAGHFSLAFADVVGRVTKEFVGT